MEQNPTKIILQQPQVKNPPLLGNIIDKSYFYKGPFQDISKQLVMIDIKQQIITTADIHIEGQKIKDINDCSIIVTFIAGLFFIFPFFFMLCNWWKKITFSQYQIDHKIYQNLVIFIQKNNNLQNLILKIQDNYFNEIKVGIIFQMLDKSQIKYFELENLAFGYNIQKKQYKNFQKYSQPLKNIKKSEILVRWGSKRIKYNKQQKLRQQVRQQSQETQNY